MTDLRGLHVENVRTLAPGWWRTPVPVWLGSADRTWAGALLTVEVLDARRADAFEADDTIDPTWQIVREPGDLETGRGTARC